MKNRWNHQHSFSKGPLLTCSDHFLQFSDIFVQEENSRNQLNNWKKSSLITSWMMTKLSWLVLKEKFHELLNTDRFNRFHIKILFVKPIFHFLEFFLEIKIKEMWITKNNLNFVANTVDLSIFYLSQFSYIDRKWSNCFKHFTHYFLV